MTAITPPPPANKFENKRFYYYATPLRRLVTAAISVLFPLFGKLRTEEVQNLPTNGPVVLFANHLSSYDVFPMQLAIPRPIFFMAKEELFHNPFMDIVIRQLGAFPVQRGARDEQALRYSLQVLAKGQVLGIFPEGTRSRGQGLQPGKTGAARLAIMAHCPVVLMAVDGTQNMFAKFPRRISVKISLSPPVYPRPDESPLDFTDRLMFTLARMLPFELRGVYTIHPKGFRG